MGFCCLLQKNSLSSCFIRIIARRIYLRYQAKKDRCLIAGSHSVLTSVSFNSLYINYIKVPKFVSFPPRSH